MKDLLIIGGGPAGMSAALNAQNDGLDFQLIEAEEEGWFSRVSVDSHYTVDNYLGFSKVSGTELISRFQKHLRNNQIFSEKETVESIYKEKDVFQLNTNKNIYQSHSVILATGTIQKKLDLPNIDKFLETSIFHYCVSEGRQFTGKKVLVLGGRNTGAVTGLYLNNIGCNVEVIEKSEGISAKDKYASKIMDQGIPYRTGTEIVNLKGEDNLESVTLKSSKGYEEVSADAIFVCIGLKPNNSLATQLGVKLDEWGYISTDSNMATNIDGAYAAGDVTGNLKQIIVAAAQGSIAAYNANKYVRSKCKE
ncbi:MAG: NAD(P)/FAD-dependent oxidoreductase [Myxococcota bacterium]